MTTPPRSVSAPDSVNLVCVGVEVGVGDLELGLGLGLGYWG